MTKTPTVTKRNSVAKTVGIRKGDSNRAAIKQIATGATKADKIKRDLEKRRMQNRCKVVSVIVRSFGTSI
jgi:hypothetical protein